jgi:hypothetical protein
MATEYLATSAHRHRYGISDKSRKDISRISILNEIENVIVDAKERNGDLQHRGHVVAISLMCALDAISSYGYRGEHIAKFVQNHFPEGYRPYADDLYELYRCSLIHSWNLFEAAILPGNEAVKRNGSLSFGLLNFFDALRHGVADFFDKLPTDTSLQANTLRRYAKLRNIAKP